MKPKINSMQLLSLLFVSRFFTLLVAVPNSRFTLEGSSSLIPPLLSGAGMALAGIPLLILMKRCPQQSLSAIAKNHAPKLQKPILLWQLLLCLLTAIAAASQSEYFVSTALYPNAKQQWVAIFFLLVVWYLCAMGIESISRTALLVCGLIVLSFGLIFSGVFSELDWLNLGSPFGESLEKIGVTALAYWGQNMELILLCILQPHTHKSRFKRDFFSFLLGGLLITEVITFFTTAVLGSYGQTRMFPVYTLAALSGHGFFSRLDYLHIINWTFACLLRCGMFASAAILLLRELFPKAHKSFLQGLVAAILTAATLGLIPIDGSFRWFYMIFASGVPVLVTVVLLPLLFLWKTRRKKA